MKGDNLLVIGGWNGSRLSDVKLIRFSNEKESCVPHDLDHSVVHHGSVATSKGVITCGGVTKWERGKAIDILSKCFLQTSFEQTSFPSMVQKRASFQMVNLEGIIYAIGGYPSYDTMEFINIEQYDIAPRWWKWHEESLPFKVDDPCVVNINTTIILIGGNEPHTTNVS